MAFFYDYFKRLNGYAALMVVSALSEGRALRLDFLDQFLLAVLD